LKEANNFIANTVPSNSKIMLDSDRASMNLTPSGTNRLTYVDAHLHLADAKYSGRIQEIIKDANENNVTRLLSNATDYQTSLQTLELARKYHPTILAAIGVHPWTANSEADCQLDRFEELIRTNETLIDAIGEIGLDGKYPQNEQTRKRQKKVFEFFLETAERHELPVIVHSRQALKEVLETLPKYNLQKILLHWYDGPTEKLRLIRDLGHLISMGPPVLYSRRMSEIAREADLSIILTETDGPVTYGGPFKGRMTKPSFVIDVAMRLAEIKSLSLERVQYALAANFRELLRE
jgi:TatD DNase family protein